MFNASRTLYDRVGHPPHVSPGLGMRRPSSTLSSRSLTALAARPCCGARGEGGLPSRPSLDFFFDLAALEDARGDESPALGPSSSRLRRPASEAIREDMYAFTSWEKRQWRPSLHEPLMKAWHALLDLASGSRRPDRSLLVSRRPDPFLGARDEDAGDLLGVLDRPPLSWSRPLD